ncbi:MAG: TonB-dependent receptor [Bryobacter sp.]|nr:TonB-dependent receptor [Bryobacter sp.]
MLDPQDRLVANAVVRALDGLGREKAKTLSSAEGTFQLVVPNQTLALTAESPGFETVTSGLKEYRGGEESLDLHFGKLSKAELTMVVSERVIEPSVDQRDAAVFNRTLFTRDDQIFQTLGAGLSLGQHSGGGKSLEVRRFGFNLDHGGDGGGVRVMMDDMLVNQISGGHAHGYLGGLKALSPELVQEVKLINGPFDAQYGDLSGLGVVTIRTRTSMPDRATLRAQVGQFNTRRVFAAYSPVSDRSSSLIANEYSYSDGPFQQPLNYLRNNTTLAHSRRLRPNQTLTIRAMANLSDYFAAGQLPVDLIEQGRLDRFGFIDPSEGGYTQQGTLFGQYTYEAKDGGIFKADGMVQRVLFDLYSNFTFFLENEEGGDGFVQHDSRLQQAANFSYQRPQQFPGGVGNLMVGFQHLDNQINLKLSAHTARVPTELLTSAQTRVSNSGWYAQENLTLAGGKVQLGLGGRWDQFWFRADDQLVLTNRPRAASGLFQPKASFAFTPKLDFPFTMHVNYGRSVTSSNVRALILDPESPLTASTDFLQLGTSHNKGRFSVATSLFLINRSNQQIYVADAGFNELAGPTRSYGFEVKTSTAINRYLSLNASLTKVLNSYFKDTEPREYIDRAPRFTGYVGLTLTQWKGWNGSLRFRTINRFLLYREDGSETRVPGHSVTDFFMARRINRWLELNFSVDNIFDKQYFETFSHYTSRVAPGAEAIDRIHGTPGYPLTVVGGVTVRLFPKGE